MSELVLFLAGGVVFFFLFLLWLLTNKPNTPRADVHLPLGTLERIVPLRGLAFGKPELLLDDRDYRMLASVPSLKAVARELRHDRKVIALLWLGLLEDDVLNLWRFRRLLARNGFSTGLTEELRVASAFSVAITLLAALRLAVWVAGPFALPRLLIGVKEYVERSSCRAAQLLGRVPASAREQILQAWSSEQSAL